MPASAGTDDGTDRRLMTRLRKHTRQWLIDDETGEAD
jgi:hypothetical protein